MRRALAAALLATALAAADDALLPGLDGVAGAELRPHLAIGVASASHHGLQWGGAAIAGARGLLSPNGTTWIGVEASWLRLDDGLATGLARDWVLGGLVVEQTVARRFRLAAGSLAAIGVQRGSADGADLMVEFAWLPPLVLAGAVPRLAYRNDTLIASPLTSVRSLSLGLAWSW